MDIKTREELLRERNATIKVTKEEVEELNDDEYLSPASAKKVVTRTRTRNQSDSSSMSSFGSKDGGKTTSLAKKVNLAIVKQKRKESGQADLLRSLEEYVSFDNSKFLLQNCPNPKKINISLEKRTWKING
jgi:hypothetical protein